MFVNFLKESVSLWLEVSPYLLLGMFIAGILHVYIGKDFILRHLGKGGLLSIIKATIFGIPLPVCSCGVIPLASSISKDGAHKSSVLSFMISTPTTGVDSIFATYSLMGPLFAIFRPLAALISGILVGGLHYFSGGRHEKAVFASEHRHKKEKLQFKIKEHLLYAFYELPQDIGKWLIIGTLFGGFISAVIPQDLFTRYFAFPMDFIIVLLISIPLYVCATGSIPIAVALIAKGFSPGAALVFLIAGPATNAITLSFVRVKFGKKAFYIYLIAIIVSAILMGLVFNFIWNHLSRDPVLITGAGKMLPDSIKVAAAALLALLIANSSFKNKKALLNYDIKLLVPDIHCRQCKMKLERDIKKINGVTGVLVDVDKKSIQLKGDFKKEDVFDVIKNSGYSIRENND